MRARRWWAWPLVPVYAFVQRLYERFRRPPRKLHWPVISVGSISAGGAGKTPIVIALADLLRTSGWSVDVLSRGYRRAGDKVARVEPESDGATVRFGDEPVLIAKRARIPVWVAPERFDAGAAAEQLWDGVERRSPEQRDASGTVQTAIAGSRHVHLLDDGFQHRQLERSFDIAVVTAEDLDDALLPAGNRREGLSGLRRADAIVVRSAERALVVNRVKRWMQRDCVVWTVRRSLRFSRPLAVLGLGARPIAFCAIARPQDFARMLEAAGCLVVDTVEFTDHHAYREEDMERIVARARQRKATGFVTTEKDAVKLTAAMRQKLQLCGPLLVATLQVEFDNPELVAETLAERLR